MHERLKQIHANNYFVSIDFSIIRTQLFTGPSDSLVLNRGRQVGKPADFKNKFITFIIRQGCFQNFNR